MAITTLHISLLKIFQKRQTEIRPHHSQLRLLI